MNDESATPPETLPISSPSGERKSRGRPFERGNTMGKGRPKGSHNKTTVLVKKLLSEHAEEMTGKLVDKARKGNLTALKLVFDRICPPSAEEPVTWTMPVVQNAGDLVPAYSAVLEAVANGDLSPRQAQEITSILDSMQSAFKNKMGPPMKHMILFKYVDPRTGKVLPAAASKEAKEANS